MGGWALKRNKIHANPQRKELPINKHAIWILLRYNVALATSADVVASLRAKFEAVLPHRPLTSHEVIVQDLRLHDESAR
jgi:hypothetical protein